MSLDPLLLEIGVSVAAVYGILALVSPKIALYLLVPVIAMAPEVRVAGLSLRPDDVMLAGLAVAWGLKRLAAPRERTPLDRPLLAYVGIGLVSTLWGAAIGTADIWSVDQLSASGFHVLKRIELVLLFAMIADTIRSIAEARRFSYVFMVSLAGLSAYSLMRFYDTGLLALAPAGAAVHEPGLAAMLNVALALGFVVTPRGGQSPIAGVVLLASLWVLPFTLGRNFMVATAAMFVLVALLRRRSLLLLVPAAAAVAPLVLPQRVLARLLSIRWAFAPALPDPSVGAAIYLPTRLQPGYVYGWNVLTSSPLLGWGLASVALGSIDSEYSWQFVSTGVVGVVIFLWLARRIASMAGDVYRAAKARNAEALPLAAGLQHALLGYGLYSIFSPSISASRAGALFFIILGLLTVLHRDLGLQAAEEPALSGREPLADVRYPLVPERKRQSGQNA